MTDPAFAPDSAKAVNSAQSVIRGIFEWLASPLAPQLVDELPPLRSNLLVLRDMPLTPRQHTEALDQIYARSITVVTGLLPELTGLPLPLPRKARHMVRNVQDLLRMLAEDTLAMLDKFNGQPASTHRLCQPQSITLWRSMYALNQHLLISDLVASPAGIGIWQQLHQIYVIAQHLQLTASQAEGAERTLQQLYYSTLLLGCAQPASFTSHETEFVIHYIQRFADRVDPLDGAKPPDQPGVFWVASLCDTPPVAYLRKRPPPDTSVHYFSCDRLAALLNSQLLELDAGSTAQQLGLPDFAGGALGQGVMRRLASYWGRPGKRRYQRRRQNYRATLCTGFDNLWHLFQEGSPVESEVSNWMITNESPDGYAIMHVSGKLGQLSVGDVVAIRTESSSDWSIGLFRWALSENPEHLEFGLQILASCAVSAILAQVPEISSATEETEGLRVLILPEIPRLRSTEMLMLPSGALRDQQKKLVLVISRENVEVREVRATHLDEQTRSIEVFSILPETSE